MEYIYLDQAAGSFPKAPGVGAAMAAAIDGCGGNINRSTYKLSTDTALRVMDVRDALADFFGCEAGEHLIFTPGATYSINAVMRGLLKKGDHLIISGMEHNAVWRTAKELEARGISLSTAPCSREGFIDLSAFEALFCGQTKLVMLAHASNVNGAIQDVSAISGICKRHGVMLALDASQTAGHIPLKLKELGADAICFPGHKGLGGPQGIGGIALSEQMAGSLKACITGGTGSRSSSEKMPEEYPDHLEPGTPNLPGILGLGAALEHIKATGLDTRREKEISLTARMLEGLKSCRGVYVPGPEAEGRVGVVSVDFTDHDNGEMAARLEQEFGILTRCGLHCAPLAHKSLGTYPQGTVRFSFGWTNSEQDVDTALEAIRIITSENKK